MLEVLGRHGVDFVVVGGVAGCSPRLVLSDPTTSTLRMSGAPTNLERLASALSELHATLRGAPSRRAVHPRRGNARARRELHVHNENTGDLDVLSASGWGRVRTTP